MTSDAPDPKLLGGLARSIDRLFAAPRGEDGTPSGERFRATPPEPAVTGPSSSQVPEEVSHLADLVRALGQERNETARARLVESAVRRGLPATEAIAEALARTDDRSARRAYIDAFVAMGPAALPVVEAMLEDSRWFVVRNGVAVLGEVRDDRAVGWLVGVLARPEPRLRRDALLALAKIGGEDAGILAFGMLDDPDASVRAAAAIGVGRARLERAVRPLVRLLAEEDDVDVLAKAIRALGEIGDPGAVHAIERHAVGSFLRRPPIEVRLAAYRALRSIGTPHARRVLNQAVDDRSPDVRAEVRQMLGMA